MAAELAEIVWILRPAAPDRAAEGFRFADLNPAGELAAGLPRAQIVGRELGQVLEPRLADAVARAGREALRLGVPVREQIFRGERGGAGRWLEREHHPLGDHLVVITRDLTERNRAEKATLASLQERELMLQEMSHRVKNNLQVVSSLLSLQARQVDDPRILELFRESQGRVRSIALFHEKLYRSRERGQVDARDYLSEVVAGAVRAFEGGARVEHQVLAEALPLGVDAAVPCGLILNELVSNALKHAFPGRAAGRIEVRLRRLSSARAGLTVSDDGVGFPEGFDLDRSASLGLQLVRSLTEQLGGTLELSGAGGATVELRFPLGAQPG